MINLEKQLQELPSDLRQEAIDFIEFLQIKHQKRINLKKIPSTSSIISESEHQRILEVLDTIVAATNPAGPPVNNQEHDLYLYGNP